MRHKGWGKRMITIISVLAGLSVLAAAYHPLVPVILQSERHGLLSDGVMLITMKKRDSSEMKTFPVDYLREGNMVYIGSDSDWWKHLEGGAEVTMLIQGAEVTGWAIPILDDPERSSAGFKKLRPWTYMRAEWTGAIFVEVEIQDQTQDNKSGP